MIPEPKLASTQRGPTPYRGRWRWWYASICDYRLAHPGCLNKDIALHLKKSENTISAIVNTDLYRDYEVQRRQAWRESNERALREKLTVVTTLALDSVEAQLRKRGDQIPLAIAKELVETGLDRLGFGPTQAPAPTVIVNNQQMLIPNSVSASALAEARNTLRTIEQTRLKELAPPDDVSDVLDGFAVDVVSEVQDGGGTPSGASERVESEGTPDHASVIDS